MLFVSNSTFAANLPSNPFKASVVSLTSFTVQMAAFLNQSVFLTILKILFDFLVVTMSREFMIGINFRAFIFYLLRFSLNFVVYKSNHFFTLFYECFANAKSSGRNLISPFVTTATLKGLIGVLIVCSFGFRFESIFIFQSNSTGKLLPQLFIVILESGMILDNFSGFIKKVH